MSQYEREIEALEGEYAKGEITLQQFNQEMRELERDYARAAEESAQEAYRRELDNW